MGSRWSSLHSSSVVAQAARFAAVGVANTAVYYGSYLLLRLALSFLAADVLAVVVAMLFAFFAHSAITYRTRPTLRKLLLFPLGNIAGYLVLTLGAWALVRSGVNDRWAPLAAAAVSVPVTFVVLRLVLLGRRADEAAVNEPAGRPAGSGRGSSS
jgi:putative flippase GtrA